MGYRNIVVDGTPYRWTVGSSCIAIRGEKKGHWTFPFPQPEDYESTISITPSYVADLIRTEIEKRPAAAPRPIRHIVVSCGRKPAPRQAVVGRAYCVFTKHPNEYAGLYVNVLREVHLDAAMAKERAKALGGYAEEMPLHDAVRH